MSYSNSIPLTEASPVQERHAAIASVKVEIVNVAEFTLPVAFLMADWR
ncbi:MAG: hypothetical protein OXC95_11160 [Dehalococcoidia bacterium]|nr:hypothetical protein [Dehalococcoidia bacterium]